MGTQGMMYRHDAAAHHPPHPHRPSSPRHHPTVCVLKTEHSGPKIPPSHVAGRPPVALPKKSRPHLAMARCYSGLSDAKDGQCETFISGSLCLGPCLQAKPKQAMGNGHWALGDGRWGNGATGNGSKWVPTWESARMPCHAPPQHPSSRRLGHASSAALQFRSGRRHFRERERF